VMDCFTKWSVLSEENRVESIELKGKSKILIADFRVQIAECKMTTPFIIR
jgi:hypothetical protein